MPISIDWSAKVIFVPKDYLALISGTLYELDTEQFRLDLKSLEDCEEGIVFPDTHIHNTEVTVAGTTFARTIEITNGYSITFEDGQYSVILAGSNNNFFDVENSILNQNQVQIIAQNSAGLVRVNIPVLTDQNKDDIVDGVWEALWESHSDVSGSFAELAMHLLRLTGNKVTKTDNIITIYKEDEATPWKQYDLADGGRVVV